MGAGAKSAGTRTKTVPFAIARARRRVRPRRTRPYTPRTNGKAERFIQSMLRECAYQRPFLSRAPQSARRLGRALQPPPHPRSPRHDAARSPGLPGENNVMTLHG